MDVARDEVFGRVLSVIPVDTLDEAIAVVNASRFGNGASIFTGSGAAVRRFRRDVEAGMVGVNIRAPVALFPFSGSKDCFLGDLRARPRRGRVLHALEDRHEPLLVDRAGQRRLLRRALRRSWRQRSAG